MIILFLFLAPGLSGWVLHRGFARSLGGVILSLSEQIALALSLVLEIGTLTPPTITMEVERTARGTREAPAPIFAISLTLFGLHIFNWEVQCAPVLQWTPT